MSQPNRTLRDAPWLADDGLQNLLLAIAGPDEEIRIVGGAVRNTLLGRPVVDIDLATTALPELVIKRARDRGMKPVPTGLAHGTITVVVAGRPFEVTTLREDVATDGRRAIVKFGRDWTADANRRDFTINALYATGQGDIIDLVGGIADCDARRVRFIGDAERRIREDYLRILRFFRFHATLSDGPPDAEGLAAASALRNGITTLSSERVGQELLKLVAAEHAPNVLSTMARTSILPLALGTHAVDLDAFTRLHLLRRHLQSTPGYDAGTAPAILLLASLCRDRATGCLALAHHLRLSNAARSRMIAAWEAVPAVTPSISDQAARACIFRVGPEAFSDAVLLAAGTSQDWQLADVVRLARIGTEFRLPTFPISGRDLMATGIAPGPTLGALVEQLRDLWIASDFKLTREELLNKLGAGSGPTI